MDGRLLGRGQPLPATLPAGRSQRLVELACGRGRDAAHILPRAGSVTLVDVNESNIAACRLRFADQPQQRSIHNTGNDLPGIADASQTALFCYDALVHFELLEVLAYLTEARRILAPGGRALLHLSNSMENPEGNYRQNRHWRNFGSLDSARHLAARVGLPVLEAKVIDWSGEPELDGLLEA